MPQYSFSVDRLKAGMLASSYPSRIISRLFPALAQQGTLTVGGTATDGNYVSTWVVPKFGTITVTTVRSTTPATNDDLAAQHAADINAHADLSSFVTATAAGAVVTYVHRTAGEPTITVTTAAPSPGTLVHALTVDPVVARLPVGIGVAQGANGRTRALAATDLPENFLGFVKRDEAALAPNTGVTTDIDGYDAGATIPVVEQAEIAVQTETAVADGDVVHVRKSGTGTIGACRNTSAGTAQLVTATPTAANDTEYQLAIHVTQGPGKGETHVIQTVSDASATATEICDGLRTSLNANARLAALITDGGTATLTLAATDAETQFEVEDIGAGAWASITVTTAAAPETFTVPGAKFVVPDGANTPAGTAVVRCNLPAAA